MFSVEYGDPRRPLLATNDESDMLKEQQRRNFRALLKERGIRSRDLAGCLGVSEQRARQLWDRPWSMNPDQVRAVCDLLEVGLYALRRALVGLDAETMRIRIGDYACKLQGESLNLLYDVAQRLYALDARHYGQVDLFPFGGELVTFDDLMGL